MSMALRSPPLNLLQENLLPGVWGCHTTCHSRGSGNPGSIDSLVAVGASTRRAIHLSGGQVGGLTHTEHPRKQGGRGAGQPRAGAPMLPAYHGQASLRPCHPTRACRGAKPLSRGFGGVPSRYKDASCRESEGVPQISLLSSPQEWGTRGLKSGHGTLPQHPLQAVIDRLNEIVTKAYHIEDTILCKHRRR
jgi:hypothetical protein